MIPQEADKTHIEYGFPVPIHDSSGSPNKLKIAQICVTSAWGRTSFPKLPSKLLLKTPLGNFFFRRSGKTFQIYLHRRSIFNIITKNSLKENKIQPWFSVLERC